MYMKYTPFTPGRIRMKQGERQPFSPNSDRRVRRYGQLPRDTNEVDGTERPRIPQPTGLSDAPTGGFPNPLSVEHVEETAVKAVFPLLCAGRVAMVTSPGRSSGRYNRTVDPAMDSGRHYGRLIR